MQRNTRTHSILLLDTSIFLLIVSLLVLVLGWSSLARAEDVGQYISDAALTAKVKAALSSDSELKTTHVNVETTQGVVELKGTVMTRDQATEAVNTAKVIDGVRLVSNLLYVTRGGQEE